MLQRVFGVQVSRHFNIELFVAVKRKVWFLHCRFPCFGSSNLDEILVLGGVIAPTMIIILKNY